MADEIVVMQAGKVEQAGPPLELYDRPSNLFVAGFIGSPAMNFLEGTVTRINGHAGVLTDDGTTLSLGSRPRASDGQRVVFGTRPEHLELVGEGEGLVVDVIVVEPTGSETLMVGEMAGIQIQAAFRERHRFAPGQRIHLRPDPKHVHVFDAQSGQRL